MARTLTAREIQMLTSTATRFRIEGDLADIQPFGSGHINDTYLCSYKCGNTESQWVLQRVNHHVFRQPHLVMENIGRVTRHICCKVEAAGGDPDRAVMQFVPTSQGGLLYERHDGTFWRVSKLIAGTQTFDEPDSPERVYAAAHAFGRFQALLADLDGGRLHEIIPGFHDTRSRFDALTAAAGADSCNRAGEARAEIAFAEARADRTAKLRDMHGAGELPERVTHNDTKLNNVLFDQATGEALCVIDLDTV
ncbi:MAG: phosphotransferase, partial [Chitinivibrionales bacterium]|nr:phosphotransferase [Chitinivibrionales bacterium]